MILREALRPAVRGHVRVWAIAAAVLTLLTTATAVTVSAHPLGNTSVNLYERVEIGPQEIGVRFILDISEIPALREKEFADTDDDGSVDETEATTYLNGFWEYLEPNLTLTIEGQPQPLQRLTQSLTFPAGQGGLQLMRAVYDLTATQKEGPAGRVIHGGLTETAFEGVPGWHEMVVVAKQGVSLSESSVPESDITDELTVYPPEMLTTPLSVREATFTYTVESSTASPATASLPPPTATAAPQPVDPGLGPRPTDPLVALLEQPLDSAASMAGLLLALSLGALHAVTPGHGKTLVAAYLLGSRARMIHGVWLGTTVAVTHTAGVFVLGVAILGFTELVIPERVVGWLSVITGLLITGLGLVLVWRSRSLAKRSAGAKTHQHSHTGRGTETHDHHHDQAPDLRGRDVAVLGIVGGLVPSGSALLLLLSAVALDKILYGLLLIVAFGLGMALVLVGVSSGIVLFRRSSLMDWGRWRDPRLHRVASWVPVISGLVVVVLGAFLTVEALKALP